MKTNCRSTSCNCISCCNKRDANIPVKSRSKRVDRLDTGICGKRIRTLRYFNNRKVDVPSGSIIRVDTTWGGAGGLIVHSPNPEAIGKRITGIAPYRYPNAYEVMA